MEHLRVVVATPLTEEHARLLRDADPRLEVVLEPDLLPPMRYPGDHGGDPDFTRTPEQQARFEQLCDGADALYGIPDTDPAQLARTVAANPRLQWVMTMAAGGGAQVRAAGLSRAELDRVAFTTSAGVHARPLAEFAVFGVLCGAKDLPRLRALQQRHEWPGRWAMRQVFEMTVLVVGMGHIGRETAAAFARLGARVIGANRTVREVEGVDHVVPMEQLGDAVAEADAVINCLPDAEGTEGVISAEVLARLREGTILVSTGRGSTIDEPAMVTALQDGRLGFACLDVVATEPLPADSPLWDLPNVLLSPHTAALNDQEDRLIAEQFAANARRLLDGEPLRNRVDTERFY